VTRPPETQYVAVGEADVAYQVAGEGPLDLVYCAGIGHVDSRWDSPFISQVLARLRTLGRLIVFDRRGTGASDPVPPGAMPTWEGWSEDLLAVLDAVESDRAAIIAVLDGGPMAMVFAALHPERVRSLLLSNTTARYLVDDDYPIGATQEAADAIIDSINGDPSTWRG
jgi:pimeloyl-ACP methyl ester carboxylesterase